MTSGEQKRSAVYASLFKWSGLYRLVDPDGPKAFGRVGLYTCLTALLAAYSTAVTLVGFTGVAFALEESADTGFQNMQRLFATACIVVGNLKIATIAWNARDMFALFEIADESFLQRSGGPRDGARGHFWRTAVLYFLLLSASLVLWISTPVVLNLPYFAADETEPAAPNVRKHNFYHLKYPGNAALYNLYFEEFYVSEAFMLAYSIWCIVIFDLFAFAILQLLTNHYEVVMSAFENLDFEVKNVNGKKLTDEEIRHKFISVVLDCQTIFEKLQLFYKISSPMVVIQLIGDATGMITMPYLVVLSVQKSGSINLETLTFLLTLSTCLIQSYTYCSLFQLVDDHKDDVNFGLYSCDWTRLDVPTKKLILQIMRMNSSNNLKIKVTPTMFIDLPMFAAVVRSSYSVTSVMINKSNTK